MKIKLSKKTIDAVYAAYAGCNKRNRITPLFGINKKGYVTFEGVEWGANCFYTTSDIERMGLFAVCYSPVTLHAATIANGTAH